MKTFWGTYVGSRKHRMMFEDRSVSPDKKFGQSTVELALILPVLIAFLYLIIFGFRTHHQAADVATGIYADRVAQFDHGNGSIFDPDTGTYVNAGKYSEHIPEGVSINIGDVLTAVLPGVLADLGLNELFSRLKIFDDSTYMGAFAQGFTYSLASSATHTLIETGSLHDMSAQDLENAAWAGASSALSSDQASEDFQGADQTGSSAREFFGSGAQAGLIGFADSHGDFANAGTSAVGGMLHSDTTKNWSTEGTDFSQIMKGAGLGAVESSASGVINGNFDTKTVLIAGATGAVQTDAFARSLPFTGSDPKNSAMYGAFNGAFSSAISGGDAKTTLVAAGTGALGTKQTMDTMGGPNSFGYRAVSMVGGAAGQWIMGESLESIGKGALTGAIGQGMGWAGNEVSQSLSKNLSSSKSKNEATTMIDQPKTADDLANDESFAQSTDEILNSTTEGMLDSQTLESMELEEVPST